MEQSRKKLIMISVIVVCVALAAAITYRTCHGRSGTLDDIPESEMIWVKGANKNCGAEYQMSKKEYFKDIEEHMDPMVMTAPPLICKKCGEPSIYRAEKCEKCGKVFSGGVLLTILQTAAPNAGIAKQKPPENKEWLAISANYKRPGL